MFLETGCFRVIIAVLLDCGFFRRFFCGFRRLMSFIAILWCFSIRGGFVLQSQVLHSFGTITVASSIFLYIIFCSIVTEL